MDDRTRAQTVDVTVDHTGKLWVNVDGRCVLRIDHCDYVMFDSSVFGRQSAYVERSDKIEALRQHQDGEE